MCVSFVLRGIIKILQQMPLVSLAEAVDVAVGPSSPSPLLPEVRDRVARAVQE